jgi:hypothetical protein
MQLIKVPVLVPKRELALVGIHHHQTVAPIDTD